jgi:chromate transporter
MAAVENFIRSKGLNPPTNPQTPVRHPSFAEAFLFWLKLGFISFGGPTGQIAIMYAELVEKKRWISENRFLHALNYCMLLPGPEAQQLCIYVGWLLHRTWGGIVAGALFVLPSMGILWLLSYVYVVYGQLPWIAAVFHGLQATVLAIVFSAVLRIGKKALKNSIMWTVAGAAFVGIYFLKLPFPLIILAAGVIGLMGGYFFPSKFVVIKPHGKSNTEPASFLGDAETIPAHARPSWSRAIIILVVGGLLWFMPLLLLGVWQGWEGTLFQQGLFFSKAAMVTFGGAYAVLPYVSQQAVEHYHWLQSADMLAGLALAETTPGPLIMVLQFVGFIGAWNHPGALSPLVAATLGALITTWCTFVPCFLWIFLGAPHIEQLRDHQKLSAVLSTITAAVVGVVLNLAVWFGTHAIFPSGSGMDVFTVIVAITAFVLLEKFKWEVIPVILAGAAAGLIHSWMT